MKRIVFLLFTCVSFLICYPKNLNPVSPEGIKIIDVSVQNIDKQFDKKEFNQIKTLKFDGFFNNRYYTLGNKELEKINNLPNLETIELMFKDGGYYDYAYNINIRNNVRNSLKQIKNVILNVATKSGSPINSTFENLIDSYGHKRDLDKRISSIIDMFPNVQSIVLNYGVPSNIPNLLMDQTYALFLNPQILNSPKTGGIWGAHVMPSDGIVILERNKIPQYDKEPTIIAPNSKLTSEDVGDEFIITDNIKYIGEGGFHYERRPKITISSSDTPLYLNDFKARDYTIIDRPLIINGEFDLGYKNQKIVFKKPVQIYTNLTGTDTQEIIFEDDLTANMGVFSQIKDGIKRIEFKKIPDIKGGYMNWEETIIDIPEGTFDQFIAMGFPKKNMNAISSAPVELILDTPNSLLSHISPAKLKEVEVLKITGFMYDTDVKILSSECKNLKQLDLSQAVITTSPETQKKIDDNNAALDALLGLMAEEGKKQYNEGRINHESMEFANMLAELSKMDNKNVKKGIEQCGIPGGAFRGLKFLKSVKLPLTATYIGEGAFMECPLLKEVVFPPYLVSIRRFAFSYTGLERVKLPATLKDISDWRNGNCAFGHCENLRLDCGDCEIKNGYWDCPLYGAKTLILPKNTITLVELSLQDDGNLYCPPTLTEWATNNSISRINIYAEGPQAPQTWYGIYNCNIYVPKNALTSWYAKYGNKNKIEENTMPNIYK